MIEYKNASVSAGGKRILEDISVRFNTGRITVVVGPNGCGKTTLLQALFGISKLEKGEILLDGNVILSIKPRSRAQIVSYLPQVRESIPTIPVELLVSHGRFPHLGFSRKMTDADKKIVEKAMEKAGVLQYAGESVDTLSGGVRQRAFIAMQLAQESEYIVADEPTTYLDLPSQKQVYSLYCGLKSEGKTIILVLHDIVKALEVADDIIVMDERKIAFAGTPSEALKTGIIEKVFGVKIRTFSEAGKEFYVFD